MQVKSFTLAIVAAFFATTITAFAADPIQTDGNKYKIKFENERIRVLEYEDVPGDKTAEHRHPAFFLYALTSFKRKITLPGGKTIMRQFTAGDVMWSEEQVHTGENVGNTPTHVLMVEMKQ